MRTTATLSLGLMLASAWSVRADEPRPVPLTRPEMKQLIESVKVRTPRIPLPELTEAEKAQLGERGSSYESRLRALYLPTGEGFGFGGGNRATTAQAGAEKAAPTARTAEVRRNSDANMSLDYPFKTELFWIVSRTNNVQYCLGHQESKLLAAGLKEDEIAALDGDWADHTPAERAAFAFARKITHDPNNLTDADIDGLLKYYKDLQILEMILSTAGNNAINRWKEGNGIPQSQNGGGFGRRTENGAVAEAPATPHTYLTPTSEKFRTSVSKVAPIVCDARTGAPTTQTVCDRPALESRAVVEKALAAARARTPRLPLVDEAQARAVVSEAWPEGPLPQWVRLVANFPREGLNRVKTVRANDEKGDLPPLLKAQASWIIARQDRAWYATGLAQHRLKELGQTDDQIFALDGDWSNVSPKDRALFTVARKLAASPVVLTDDEVAQAVELAGPRDVVQMIHFTTTRAWLDRVTEAAGLAIDQ